MRNSKTTSLIKALGYSLGAFFGFAILVGVFVIPHEVTQLRNPHSVSITQLIVDEQRNLALVLCRRTPARSETSIDYGIAALKLDDRGKSLPRVVNVTKPLCMTRVSDQLIVSELGGTIRSIPLAKEGASTVVGQQPDGPALGLTGSRDGCMLLSWCEDNVCVWDLSAKKLVRQLPFGAMFALVSADSTSFYCDVRSGIAERDLVSGKVLRVVVDGDVILATALSPNGCQLASISHNGRLRVTELKSGTIAWCTSVAGDLAVSKTLHPVVLPILAFSPDGNRLLSAHQLGQAWGVTVWNATTGDVENSFHAHKTCIRDAVFSGSDVVYTGADDQSLKKWYLTSSDKVMLIGEWNTGNWKLSHE